MSGWPFQPACELRMRGIAPTSNEREYGDGAGFAPTSSTPYGPYEAPCHRPRRASDSSRGSEPSGRAIVRIR